MAAATVGTLLHVAVPARPALLTLASLGRQVASTILRTLAGTRQDLLLAIAPFPSFIAQTDCRQLITFAMWLLAPCWTLPLRAVQTNDSNITRAPSSPMVALTFSFAAVGAWLPGAVVTEEAIVAITLLFCGVTHTTFATIILALVLLAVVVLATPTRVAFTLAIHLARAVTIAGIRTVLRRTILAEVPFAALALTTILVTLAVPTTIIGALLGLRLLLILFP